MARVFFIRFIIQCSISDKLLGIAKKYGVLFYNSELFVILIRSLAMSSLEFIVNNLLCHVVF